MSDIQKVLVLGASGDQGIPLVTALKEHGAEVVAGARRLDAMKDSIYPELPTVLADIHNQESLESAFAQVDAVAMHLPFEFDMEVAGAFGRNIGRAAASAGLKKIVFNTSCVVADQDLGMGAHDGRRMIEQSIRDSGVDYVILRPAVFMDNMIRVWLKPAIVNKNMFVYPASETLKISWIWLEDLAKLSAYAVMTSSLSGESITVGGPEALTGFEVAERLSKAAGRDISFNSISPQVFAENMSELVTGSRDVEPNSVYNGMAKFYTWYNEQPVSPLAVNPDSFSDKLPIQLTSLSEWANKIDWQKV